MASLECSMPFVVDHFYLVWGSDMEKGFLDLEKVLPTTSGIK
jgi:hypothetical protein